MSAVWVVLVYGSAVVLALLLLHFFHARHWYWHALSGMLAIVIGLTPIPAGWQSPALDLAIGFLFVFLLLWGVSAPLFRVTHRTSG